MSDMEEIESVAKALAQDDGQMWDGLSMKDHYRRQAVAAHQALTQAGYGRVDVSPASDDASRSVASADAAGRDAELKRLAHRVRRLGEMSASLLRDPVRTGHWEGAEKTARQFERFADLGAKIEAILPTAPEEE